MKKIAAAAVAVVLTLGGVAVAADVGSLAWNESNVATLRSFDKAAVLKFLNKVRHDGGVPEQLTPNELGGFEWADLAGDGHYQLVLTSSGPCAHFVSIIDQDASGTVTDRQSLAGSADLKTAIRDLSGNGRDELIVEVLLVEHDCADYVSWPAVYRLEKGKYVEASRDFPEFYDNEVLPKLDDKISKGHGSQNAEILAGVIMVRDKILRVLGRDPTAGLEQARQWMKSDDPDLLHDAAVTFEEVGGHEEESRAASEAYERALCVHSPSMAMCKDAAAR